MPLGAARSEDDLLLPLAAQHIAVANRLRFQ